MKYMVDSSIPEEVAIRQAIADQNSAPHADRPVETACMSMGDMYRVFDQIGQPIPYVFSRI